MRFKVKECSPIHMLGGSISPGLDPAPVYPQLFPSIRHVQHRISPGFPQADADVSLVNRKPADKLDSRLQGGKQTGNGKQKTRQPRSKPGSGSPDGNGGSQGAETGYTGKLRTGTVRRGGKGSEASELFAGGNRQKRRSKASKNNGSTRVIDCGIFRRRSEGRSSLGEWPEQPRSLTGTARPGTET